jgi:hypothetical protein
MLLWEGGIVVENRLLELKNYLKWNVSYPGYQDSENNYAKLT